MAWRVPPARPIYEDDTVFVTRRCHRREYLLTPNDEVRNLLGYLAAVLSQERNIDLYNIVAEPNHYHADLKDNDANLPEFTRDFHSFSARALNRLFNDEGPIWSGSQQTSHVRLEDSEALFNKMLYSLLNPVKDGLVENVEDYPGLNVSWPDEPITFTRPDVWFNPKAKKKDGSQRWPDEATLPPKRPPFLEDLSDEKLRELFESERAAREKALRAEHEGGYVGAKKLKTRKRHDRPVRDKPPSKVSPTVAAKSKTKRIGRLLLDRAFRRDHDDARKALAAGEKDVVFPYGTYKMRVIYGVKVAPPPP